MILKLGIVWLSAKRHQHGRNFTTRKSAVLSPSIASIAITYLAAVKTPRKILVIFPQISRRGQRLLTPFNQFGSAMAFGFKENESVVVGTCEET